MDEVHERMLNWGLEEITAQAPPTAAATEIAHLPKQPAGFESVEQYTKFFRYMGLGAEFGVAWLRAATEIAHSIWGNAGLHIAHQAASGDEQYRDFLSGTGG